MNVNTLPIEPAPTLRQILKFKCIDTVSTRQRKSHHEWRQRKAEAVSPPGIEVEHLDVEVIELTA